MADYECTRLNEGVGKAELAFCSEPSETTRFGRDNVGSGCEGSRRRRSLVSSAVVSSRALYYGDGRRGRTGNWVDRTSLEASGVAYGDEYQHLAKVRVAGSNPVFRSIEAGRKHFFNRWSQLPRLNVLLPLLNSARRLLI